MKDSNYDIVWDLFCGRCVKCGHKGVCIHEIIPKSQLGKLALEVDNRVVLCAECHFWAHDVGSKISIPILQDLRKGHIEKYAISS